MGKAEAPVRQGFSTEELSDLGNFLKTASQLFQLLIPYLAKYKVTPKSSS